VVAGVVAPLVILVVVFGATVRAMRFVPTSAPPEAPVIEVVGHQFWWEVRYPDRGVTVRDELHLPVGRPVNLQLSSADVIHSFWVPELAGKIDMLPDHPNTLVLQADQPGRYVSRCAEYCGLEHTRMVLTVVAEPEGRFAAWVADRRG
jgi:cytochrome c oxidase subunit 2